MNKKAIHEAIVASLAAVAPEANPETLPQDADIREALDIDSMDFLTFVTGLHKALGVNVPEADYPKVRTMADCEAYLAARLGV